MLTRFHHAGFFLFSIIFTLIYALFSITRSISLSFSLVRYGLPVNFVSVVIRPHRKAHKKVSETLKELYGYLDSKFVASEIDVSSH